MRLTLLMIALCVGLCAQSGHAQEVECHDSTLLKVKGGWEKRALNTTGADPSFPKSQYPLVVNRIKAMADLLQEAYPQPMGNEAVWYPTINGSSYMTAGPLPYQLNSMYLSYFCNDRTRKIEPGGETGTWVYLYVNSFAGLFERFEDPFVIDGQTYSVFRFPPKVGTWKGLPLLEPTYTNVEESRAVVIGHRGTSPLKVLSRKDYLLGLRDIWQKKIAKAPHMKDFIGKDIAVVDRMLSESSEETLAQRAIIGSNQGPYRFDGRFSTEEEGGTLVVRLRRGYFDTTLPRDSPQFMVLYWKNDSSAASKAFRTQFEANFPLEKRLR